MYYEQACTCAGDSIGRSRRLLELGAKINAICGILSPLVELWQLVRPVAVDSGKGQPLEVW